jgi:hypothetical protein
MFKELALIVGLSAGTLLGQSREEYFTKRPEFYQKFFPATIIDGLDSYNYIESYQDNHYISSILFQRIIDGGGILGSISTTHDMDNEWGMEYSLGLDQEFLSTDRLYAEAYYMPLWYNKDGQIKDQNILGIYAEVYPLENLSLYGYLEYNVTKKVDLSSLYLTLEMNF